MLLDRKIGLVHGTFGPRIMQSVRLKLPRPHRPHPYQPKMIMPIHWVQRERFFDRGSDAEHAQRHHEIGSEALSYMMTFKTVRRLAVYDEKELKTSDMFISYLIRKSLDA